MECLFNPTQLTEKLQVNWNRLAELARVDVRDALARWRTGAPIPRTWADFIRDEDYFEC